MLDSWELAGVHAPHDIALSAAPVGATVGGSRSLAVYVAEAARGGRPSVLHKLIVHHPSAFPAPACLSAPAMCPWHPTQVSGQPAVQAQGFGQHRLVG